MNSLPQDLLAHLLAKSAKCGQVNPSAQQALEVTLKSHELQEAYRHTEFHKYVDIAIRASLAARYGAKYGNRGHAEARNLFPVFSEDAQNFLQ